MDAEFCRKFKNQEVQVLTRSAPPQRIAGEIVGCFYPSLIGNAANPPEILIYVSDESLKKCSCSSRYFTDYKKIFDDYPGLRNKAELYSDSLDRCVIISCENIDLAWAKAFNHEIYEMLFCLFFGEA